MASSRQPDMFGKPKRAKRRVIARSTDQGQFPDGRAAAYFVCRRCGWSQWLAVKSKSACLRGTPCPTCN